MENTLNDQRVIKLESGFDVWQEECEKYIDVEQVFVFANLVELNLYFANEEGDSIKHNLETLDDVENFCSDCGIFCERVLVDFSASDEYASEEPFEAIAVQNFALGKNNSSDGELKNALIEKFGY